jgi:hypothetical protein
VTIVDTNMVTIGRIWFSPQKRHAADFLFSLNVFPSIKPNGTPIRTIQKIVIPIIATAKLVCKSGIASVMYVCDHKYT